jgi:hypothetical protein
MVCFLFLLLLDVLPLWLFVKLIDQRRRKTQVRGKGHLYMAVLGWGFGLATMSAADIVLMKLIHRG